MRTLYEVPLVLQSTGMSCWAATIAMIVGWKQGRCAPDGSALAVEGGAKYATSMAKGLSPDDRTILAANGFSIEEPTCYAPDDVEQLLRLHGPLWVASAAPAPHVRVICGCAADHV
jgi:Papain-like cysteine protease AvrRpt2